MRTLSKSTDSRRAFQHMANILVPRSLFASGGSEKGELSEQCLSVSLLPQNEEWLENIRLPETLPSFIHSAQATCTIIKTSFHPKLWSSFPQFDTLSLQRFPDIFISMETTASALPVDS